MQHNSHKRHVLGNLSNTFVTRRKLGQKILFDDIVVRSILYHCIPLVLRDLVGNKFVPAKQSAMSKSPYSEYLFASDYDHKCYINTKGNYMTIVL